MLEEKRIGALDKNPVAPRKASMFMMLLLQNKKDGMGCGFDESENPVLVYAKFPNDTTLFILYKMIGKKWVTNDLINSGIWFPKTIAGKTEREPNYSGGMCIDHENTNEIYLSVKRDRFLKLKIGLTQTDKLEARSNNKTSSKIIVRPFAVLNATKRKSSSTSLDAEHKIYSHHILFHFVENEHRFSKIYKSGLM
jgi:hypothetical protein